MKITRKLPDACTITGANGVISDEALTSDECSALAYKFWLLSQTTVNQKKADLYARMHSTFAALTNDTAAIILHMK